MSSAEEASERYISKESFNFHLGVESREEEDWIAVRYERNVQSQNHNETFSKLSDERTKALSLAKAPVIKQ